MKQDHPFGDVSPSRPSLPKKNLDQISPPVTEEEYLSLVSNFGNVFHPGPPHPTKNIDEMIEIFQAARDGKPIQYRTIQDNATWEDMDCSDIEKSWYRFDFCMCDFRIKPSADALWREASRN